MLGWFLDLYHFVSDRPVIVFVGGVAWLCYYLGSGQLAERIAADKVAEIQRQIDHGYIEREVERRLREGTKALEEHAKGYDLWVKAVAVGFAKVLMSENPHEMQEWRSEMLRVIQARQTPLRLLAQLAIYSGHPAGQHCPYRVEQS